MKLFKPLFCRKMTIILLFLITISAFTTTTCIPDYTLKGEEITISFNADGGTGTIPPPIKIYLEYMGSTYVTLPDADLQKDGFEFVCWKHPDYSLYYSAGEQEFVTKSIEYLATYKDNSNVPTVPPNTTNPGNYVTQTGTKFHKYGHMGATIPISQGKNGPYTHVRYVSNN